VGSIDATDAVDPGRAHGHPGSWRDGLRPTVESWLTARVVVLAALAFSRYVVDHVGDVSARVSNAVHAGLTAWDGSWYADIAAHGYASLPREALRFFPGLPLTARGIAVLGIGEKPALVLVSNVAALAAGLLLHRLVQWETGDRALAARSVWLLALAPPAFVFVMGYTDSTAVFLAVATVFLCRRRQWWGAALCALVAGLFRPTASLLVVPALVEALPTFLRVAWRERIARIAAVVAAPVGTLVFLAWVGSRFDDFTLPFSEQTSSHLRGHLTDPVSAIVHAVRNGADGHLGVALHLPWLVLVVVLAVVACRTLPLSYGLFAVAVVATSVTSNNLDSMERYALFAFPLVIAGAWLLRSREVARIVFVLSAVAMFGYASLAFLGLIGP
jgi:hypothetical protein